MLKLAAAILTLLGLASMARADETVIVLDETPGHLVFQITGEIDMATYYRFGFEANERRGGTLLLRSPGGNALASLSIGEEVRRLGWTTVVPAGAGCYSGCALIWAGGVERRAGRGAQIGFHDPFWQGGEGRVIASALSGGNVGDYLRRLGLSEEAIVAFRHPPPDVFVLTKENAAALGVTARFD